MREALGVDIGNVIINHRLVDQDDKVLYEERYSTIPATEGVFEAIKDLNDKKFQGDIFLISKCTEWAEKKILEWLRDNQFYEKTGVKQNNVLFCRERHEKERICQEKNIKYFVDDRLEVLSYMVNNTTQLFLYQPDHDEVDKFKEFLPSVTVVQNWSEIIEKIK